VPIQPLGGNVPNEPAVCQDLRNQLRALSGQFTFWFNRLNNDPNDSEAQQTVSRLESEMDGIRQEMRTQGCLVGPSPEPLKVVGIAGLEATQAIQLSNVTKQSSGAAADNSVTLVEGKDTVVRVYPDAPRDLGSVASTLTGSLNYERWSGSIMIGSGTVSPINGPISAVPIARVDRGDPNQTLNFRVPGEACGDTMIFSVTIWDPAHSSDYVYTSLIQTLVMNYREVGELRVHGVLIHWTGTALRGNPLDLPSPSALQLVRILAQVLRMYPVPGFQYTGCEVMNWGESMLGPKGWQDLLAALAKLSFASGANAVYVGLLPADTPGGGILGYGATATDGSGKSVAVTSVYENDTGRALAQEMGHGFLGAGHVPCGSPPNPDTSYPNYGSFFRGSIGEYGFDTVAGTIFNPRTVADFMSYCSPVWVSPYTWNNILNGLASGQYTEGAISSRASRVRRMVEMLLLDFQISRGGHVELHPSLHLSTPSDGESLGPESSIYCVLLDGAESVLGEGRAHQTFPSDDPTGGQVRYNAILPWSPDARKLAVYRHRECLAKLEIAAEAPKIKINKLEFAGEGKKLAGLRWSAEATQEIRYIVRYTHDDGTTWRAVAADLEATHTTVDLDLLPGGEHCRFQIVGYAGMRTGTAESKDFAVDMKPRTAIIVSPEPDQVFEQNDPVVLLGGGFSADRGSTLNADVVWTSRIDGYLGTGHHVVATNLRPGRHWISVHVPDAQGAEATAGVYIEILPRGAHERAIPRKMR
jgi:hypothetical protein